MEDELPVEGGTAGNRCGPTGLRFDSSVFRHPIGNVAESGLLRLVANQVAPRGP